MHENVTDSFGSYFSEMDILILSVITAGLVIAFYFQRGHFLQQIYLWRKYISDINKFPGPKPSLILGSSLEYVVPRAGKCDLSHNFGYLT